MTANATAGGARITAGRAPRTLLELIVNQTDPTADALVAEARRAVHESLILLPAWEADRVRSLIADLETAVEGRAAMRTAVVAPQTDRAAVLAEAIGRLEEVVRTWQSEQRWRDGKGDSRGAGVLHAIEQLRRLAVEAHDTGTQQPEADALVRVRAKATEWAALAPADDWGDTPQDTALADAGRYLLALIDGAGAQQQPDTEAQPPHHRWYTEQLDPVANEWAPGWRFTDRSEAVERYRILCEHGAPAERRLVRETTTYTVEEPAPVAQQPAAEAEQDDTVHSCPGRWGGPNCRCFDAEPAPGEQQTAAADDEGTEARRG